MNVTDKNKEILLIFRKAQKEISDINPNVNIGISWSKERYFMSSEDDKNAEEDVAVICTALELPLDLLKSKNRSRGLVDARKIICYFLRKKYEGLSLQKIGILIGGKDHATVLHHINKYSDLLETDKDFKWRVSVVTAKMKENESKAKD